MRRQLVPGLVVRLTVIKAKTRPGIEAKVLSADSAEEPHPISLSENRGALPPWFSEWGVGSCPPSPGPIVCDVLSVFSYSFCHWSYSQQSCIEGTCQIFSCAQRDRVCSRLSHSSPFVEGLWPQVCKSDISKNLEAHLQIVDHSHLVVESFLCWHYSISAVLYSQGFVYVLFILKVTWHD